MVQQGLATRGTTRPSYATWSRLEYSLASIILNSLVVPYMLKPLRSSLPCLPCSRSFQSDLPVISRTDLQTQLQSSLMFNQHIVSSATVYRICIKTASTQHQHSTTADMQAGCFLLQPLTLDSRFLQERFAPVYAVEDVSNKKAQNG